jgi:hypothetical protein
MMKWFIAAFSIAKQPVECNSSKIHFVVTYCCVIVLLLGCLFLMNPSGNRLRRYLKSEMQLLI